MTPEIPETMYVTLSLHGGGAERLLTNIVLKQVAPERISVISLVSGGVYRKPLEDAGIRVTELGLRSNRDAVRGILAIRALIRERQPAAIYSWMYHANLLALAALRLTCRNGTRLYWSTFCTDLQGAEFRGIRVIRYVNALLSRWVDGVIYNAAEARDFHRSVGFREPRSIVISNCTDPAAFRRDLQQRQVLRTELGVAPDDVVVAVLARLDPQKDWPTVLESVHGLKKVVTIAAGRGTDSLPPQSGFIPLGWRDDVVRVLSSADIFVLGSAFGEGASLALDEAMLCGLPCVVTDVGANASAVGDTGIVVEPRNPAALREAIQALAADPGKRAALGQAARLRATAAAYRDDSLRRLHLLTSSDEANLPCD